MEKTRPLSRLMSRWRNPFEAGGESLPFRARLCLARLFGLRPLDAVHQRPERRELRHEHHPVVPDDARTVGVDDVVTRNVSSTSVLWNPSIGSPLPSTPSALTVTSFPRNILRRHHESTHNQMPADVDVVVFFVKPPPLQCPDRQPTAARTSTPRSHRALYRGVAMTSNTTYATKQRPNNCSEFASFIAFTTV